MKKLKIAFITLLLSFSVHSNEIEGRVKGYIPYSASGKNIFIFSIEGQTTHNCNTTARFAIDDSNSQYMTNVSSIITALHTKEPLRVKYSNTCNSWPNSADVKLICIGDIAC